VGVALTTRALSRKATTFFKVMFALGLAMVMASMIIWWTSAAM